MPSSYFYLKASTIEENIEDVGFQDNFKLKNRFGECYLALNNQAQFNDWAQKIKARVYEIKLEDELNQI